MKEDKTSFKGTTIHPIHYTKASLEGLALYHMIRPLPLVQSLP